MSTKAKKVPAKIEKSSKAPGKAAAKPGKATKGKDSDDEMEVMASSEGIPDNSEAEELEEEAAEAASRGSGGDQAALAAASGAGEMSQSFKNFRHHPDMENFYRFIFDNDLRHEALAIIDVIMADKLAKKAAKGAAPAAKGKH